MLQEGIDGGGTRNLKATSQDSSCVSTKQCLVPEYLDVPLLDLVTVNNLASRVIGQAKELKERAALPVIPTQERCQAERKLEGGLGVRAEHGFERADRVNEAIIGSSATADRPEVRQGSNDLRLAFSGVASNLPSIVLIRLYSAMTSELIR